jgi:hypothetical protein
VRGGDGLTGYAVPGVVEFAEGRRKKCDLRVNQRAAFGAKDAGSGCIDEQVEPTIAPAAG